MKCFILDHVERCYRGEPGGVVIISSSEKSARELAEDDPTIYITEEEWGKAHVLELKNTETEIIYQWPYSYE